jgi:hypothetical protein
MIASLLALPCKMRAGPAQATVRALCREELATQAFLRSWRTRGRAVYQLPGSILYNCRTIVKDTRGEKMSPMAIRAKVARFIC